LSSDAIASATFLVLPLRLEYITAVFTFSRLQVCVFICQRFHFWLASAYLKKPPTNHQRQHQLSF
jgi:hypothetical protein